MQSSYSSLGDYFRNCSGLSGSCLYATQNSSVELADSEVRSDVQRLSSTGLFSLSSSSLKASGLTVAGNSVQTHGIFSLLSVRATFENCSFLGNRARGLGSEGGALYLGCASPCNPSLGLTTSVRHSSFSGNVATQGKGGAIFVQSYPGSLLIDGCSFRGNQATNGGAIFADLAVVNVTATSFVDNSAAEGGGAVFWVYSKAFPTTVVPLQLDGGGNNASYGPFIATNLVALNSSFPQDVPQVSGEELTTPILVSLLDYYGQVVTNTSLVASSSITVYCAVVDDTGVVKGSSTVPSVFGVAKFSQLVITGKHLLPPPLSPLLSG